MFCPSQCHKTCTVTYFVSEKVQSLYLFINDCECPWFVSSLLCEHFDCTLVMLLRWTSTSLRHQTNKLCGRGFEEDTYVYICYCDYSLNFMTTSIHILQSLLEQRGPWLWSLHFITFHLNQNYTVMKATWSTTLMRMRHAIEDYYIWKPQSLPLNTRALVI